MAYCTNTEVKAYLGISGTGDDSLLTTLIARAQKAIENYTGRKFEHDATGVKRYFSVGKDTRGKLLLLDEDLCAISTNGVVTNADDGSGGTAIPSAEYITHPRNKTPYWGIEILGSSSNYWRYTDDAENGIEITGKWAYSASPPVDIVQACIRYAAFLYRGRDAQVFDYTSVSELGVMRFSHKLPADIVEMLAPYVKAQL